MYKFKGHQEVQKSLRSRRVTREIKIHIEGEGSPHLLYIDPHSSSKWT